MSNIKHGLQLLTDTLDEALIIGINASLVMCGLKWGQ